VGNRPVLSDSLAAALIEAAVHEHTGALGRELKRGPRHVARRPVEMDFHQPPGLYVSRCQAVAGFPVPVASENSICGFVPGEGVGLLENKTGMHSCLESKPSVAGWRRQQEEESRWRREYRPRSEQATS